MAGPTFGHRDFTCLTGHLGERDNCPLRFMAPDDNSGAKPAGPVVLRIKLRYDDLDAMVQRFAPNVGRSGLFLPTRAVQPLGTEVKFELRLANDQPVLVGMGRVKHVRPPDPDNPRAAFGIGLELSRVSREGRE